MCLSKAYIDSGGELKLIAEEVASVDVTGDRLRLKTLFGNSGEVSAAIREIDLLGHRIILVAAGTGD